MTQVTLARNVLGNVHTLTFPDEFITNVSSSTTSEVDVQALTGSGPSSNVGTDTNGVKKILTITGNLQIGETSLVTGTSAPTIVNPVHLKYWLEGMINGIQFPLTFTSNYESYSLQSSGGSTSIEGVSIPGTWVPTKVYILSFTFDEPEASPDMFPFTLNVEVAGF